MANSRRQITDLWKGPVGPTVSSFSREASPVHLLSTIMGDASGFQTALNNGTGYNWGTANLALYIPVNIPGTITVNRLWWFNGNAVAGGTDVGIYDINGNRLVSATGTTNSGVSTPQTVTPASIITLQPGTYYIALACDNTTQKFVGLQTSQTSYIGPAVGLGYQSSAYPLPATATISSITGTAIPYPIFGFSSRTTI